MTVVNGQNPLSYVGVAAKNPPNVSVLNRAPLTTDITGYRLGDIIVNSTGATAYMLTQFSNGTAIWDEIGAGASVIATINNQAPVAGNFNMVGTANQITVTAAAGSDTFSIPAAFTAPGSITATTSVTSTTTMTAGTGLTATTGNISATAGAVNAGTSMTATLGNITATNGNLVLGTAGNKLSIATGANASVGTSGVMSGTPGSVTVATSAVTASSIILISRNTTGGTLGQLSVPTASITPGTSFVINSNANETSTINWQIIN